MNKPVKTNKTASKYSIIFFTLVSVINFLKPLPKSAHKLIVGKHINANGLPITILFDRNGKEIGRYNGDFEWDSKEVIKFITKLKNS